MIGRNVLVVLGVLLASSACTTTQQANEALETKFIGQSTDNFFLQYGPPSSSYQMNDGRMMYQWSERPRHYAMPSTSTVNVYGNTAFVNTTPGGTMTVQCEVRIVSRNGKIEQILASSDSWGMWETSRCHEVFGK